MFNADNVNSLSGQKSICLLSSVQNVLLAQAEEKEKAQNKERKKMSSCGIRKVGK